MFHSLAQSFKIVRLQNVFKCAIEKLKKISKFYCQPMFYQTAENIYMQDYTNWAKNKPDYEIWLGPFQGLPRVFFLVMQRFYLPVITAIWFSCYLEHFVGLLQYCIKNRILFPKNKTK